MIFLEGAIYVQRDSTCMSIYTYIYRRERSDRDKRSRAKLRVGWRAEKDNADGATGDVEVERS